MRVWRKVRHRAALIPDAAPLGLCHCRRRSRLVICPVDSSTRREDTGRCGLTPVSVTSSPACASFFVCGSLVARVEHEPVLVGRSFLPGGPNGMYSGHSLPTTPGEISISTSCSLDSLFPLYDLRLES